MAEVTTAIEMWQADAQLKSAYNIMSSMHVSLEYFSQDTKRRIY